MFTNNKLTLVKMRNLMSSRRWRFKT